ncbi:MAG: trypsin-like peptidase domain-containing protein [Planctomycetes bacterium]|nr:trypsin-like peptidase domain-containing protein [Planctomycetota bacterium]
MVPALVAGAAFVLATFLLLDRAGWFRPPPSGEPRPIAPRGELAPLEQSLVEVFERCSRSVAHINVAAVVRTRYGRVQQTGSGSGFVWDDAGTVVTNHHVVAGATQVQVTVGGRNYRATVVNASPNHDLAVLRLQGDVQGLVPLPLGSSSDLRVGQTAIVIGNPFGFDQTMTTGIVSALNRTLESKDGNLMHGLIQVDAAVNPGNSGGPLLDSAGRLVGVTTAIYSPSGASAGIGFAVPVDTVNAIVPRLLGGRSTQVVLGVRSDYDSYRLDPELGYVSGAICTAVLEGYGAANAGLRPFRIQETPRGEVIQQYGDVLVAIDGKPVRSFSELPRVLRGRRPGEVVKVTVIRGLPETPQQVELGIALAAEGESMAAGM